MERKKSAPQSQALLLRIYSYVNVFLINVNQIKYIFYRVSVCIILLPSALQAQNTGGALLIGVQHNPAGNERDTRIENIMNRAVIMELEQSGLQGVVLQEIPDGFTPELTITGWYLEQKNMLKLEYQLQEVARGKEFARIQLNTPITHFLDRVVANAVKELLQESQDQITRIAQEKQEQEKQQQDMQGEEPTPVAETTEQRRRIEAEARVSGAYILGRAAEHLPYGVLLEGRLSYPVVQGEQLAWRLGGSVGVLRFFPSVDYKANYVKTLVPLGLLSEVSVRREGSLAFTLWWTAGAALRPPYENEIIDKLLAPAFPYTSMGSGAQVPLTSDKLYLVTGLSGMGLFYLYEASDSGEVKTETILGANFDLGIGWRM